MNIEHNEVKKRFETTIDGYTAILEYKSIKDNILDFYHTGVPKELEGKGIGGALVKFGLEYASERQFKVIPSCPFVDVYIKRHPEFDHVILCPLE